MEECVVGGMVDVMMSMLMCVVVVHTAALSVLEVSVDVVYTGWCSLWVHCGSWVL